LLRRGDLTKKERKSYIDAVKCLQAKPARYPSDVAPGAKSRFDDYVATHINQTNTIHYTGNFLSWHRYYVWLYEQALRDECGYEGYQPVSIYTKYDVADLVFSGGPTNPLIVLGLDQDCRDWIELFALV
jgi:tyrosinase